MKAAEKLEIRQWWKAAGIRAVKSFAQGAIIAIGTDTVNIISTDWFGILSIAAGAAVLSLLTSLAGIPEAANGESVVAIVTDDGTNPKHAKDDE